MRHGLALGGRRRLDQIDHSFDRDSLRRIEEKLSPLGFVAAHLEELAEGRFLQGSDQARYPSLETNRFRTLRGLQLFADLEQIAHDHLIVSLFALVLVDRSRDRGRLESGIVVLPLFRGRRVHRVGDQSSAGKPNPELRCAAGLHLIGPLLLAGRIVLDQLKPIVGQRKEPDVGPQLANPLAIEADRLLGSDRIHCQRAERLGQLVATNPSHELHRANTMLVQPLRELLEHRIQRIRRHSLDDQLPSGHTDRQGFTVLVKEQSEAVRYAVDREVEQWMALRVDRVLVQRDRKLDQKIREIARKRCHGLCRRRSRGCGRGGRC